MVSKKENRNYGFRSFPSKSLRILKFIIPLLLIISIPSVTAFANRVDICNVAYDCGNQVYFTFYSYSPKNHLYFVSGSAGGYFEKALVTNKYVNFTNIALGAGALRPFQTFGLGMKGANATLILVSLNTVGVTITYSSGTPKLFFYYLSNTLFPYPSNVTVIDNSSHTTLVIMPSAYITDVPTFNACIGNCVYDDITNDTLIIKGNVGSASQTMYLCTVGACAFNIISPTSSPDNSPNIPLILLFFFIVMLVLIIAFTRRT